MTIGVRFPGHPLDPEDRLAQLLADFSGARERRIQQLLDRGVKKERISIITIETCAECRGAGYSTRTEEKSASHVVAIGECSRCPGLCIDGKAIARQVTR